MALIRCEGCGQNHYFTADMLERLVKRFQDGMGHVVSRDYPYRWEDLDKSQMVTQVKPKCLYEIDGIVPKEPKKRGRPRKDVPRNS